MSEGIPGWTGELERSFKEILFRFLEEIQSTKAALYLLTPDGSFALVTQYGFGRRDQLAAEHRADGVLPRQARQQEAAPIAFNSPDEIPDAERYLAGAGTARMLLVPLCAGPTMVGFVDARDKGRKKPFAPADLATARRIAEALLRLTRESGVVAEAASHVADAPSVPATTTRRRTSDRAAAILDEHDLGSVQAAAAHMVRSGEVAAAALSAVSGKTAATLVLVGPGGEQIDVEIILRHQQDALQQGGGRTPPGGRWSTGRARVVEDGPPRVVQQISTAILAGREDWYLVGSALGPMGSRALEPALGRLRRLAEDACERSRLRAMRRRVVRRLLNPGDAYQELEIHCVAVSRLSHTLAAALGLGHRQQEDAALAGLVHDVGMQELEYARLYRHVAPGPEERRQYQRHVLEGERLVSEAGLTSLGPVLRHHHERWDGGGYPDRLAGQSIPLLARVVHVAEVYDVLTSASSYRPAVSRERALSALEDGAGQQFDPQVVRILAGVVR